MMLVFAKAKAASTGGRSLKDRPGLYFGQDVIGRKHWRKTAQPQKVKSAHRPDEIQSVNKTVKQGTEGFAEMTFDKFVDKKVRAEGDKLLLAGKVSGYNALMYEVSPKKGFGEALFSGEPMITHSMYANKPEHALAVIEAMAQEFGKVPTVKMFKKASSVLWATGVNKHIYHKFTRSQDWGYDNVQFYDVDNNSLDIKNADDYQKQKKDIVFGRSCEYVMAFQPADTGESNKIAEFLERRAKMGEGKKAVIEGSWYVPDWRSTMKVKGFTPTICNRKVIGNQELMILSKKTKLEGFESKSVWTGKALHDVLFKALEYLLFFFASNF